MFRRIVNKLGHAVLEVDVSGKLPDARMPTGSTSLLHGAHWARRITLAGADEDLIIAAASNGSVPVYDVAEELQLGSLTGHKGTVYAIAKLAGDIVATTGGDGFLCLWNARTSDLLSKTRVSEERLTALAKFDEDHIITGDVCGEIVVLKIGDQVPSAVTNTRAHGLRNVNKFGEMSAGFRGRRFERERVWDIEVHRDTVVTVGEDGFGVEWSLVCNSGRGIKLTEVTRWKHESAALTAAVNDDYIVTAAFDEIRVRYRKCMLTKVIRGTHGWSWVHRVAFWNKCLVTAGGDGLVAVFDMDNNFPGPPLYRLNVQMNRKRYGGVRAVWDFAILNQVGLIAVSGSWDDSLHLMEINEVERSPRTIQVVKQRAASVVRKTTKVMNNLTKNMTPVNMKPVGEFRNPNNATDKNFKE